MSTIESFLNVFGWYCEARNLTLYDLVFQLGQRVKEKSQWKVLKYLPINDPSQIDGEIALCNIVKKIPSKWKLVREWSDVPGRNIDWGATKLANLTGEHGRFCSIDRASIPDRQTLCTLANVAKQWLSLLETVASKSPNGINNSLAENHENRISALKEAISCLPQGLGSWSPNVTRRLQRSDRESTTKIDRAIRLWEEDGYSGKKLSDAFSKWVKNWIKDFNTEANLDLLFEWTITLTLAKLASEAKWTLSKENYFNGSSKIADLHFEKDQYRLKISKGYPTNFKNEPILSRKDDQYIQFVEAAGSKASGLQPDIVLTFGKHDKPESVITFLADAKNNSLDCGQSYIAPSIIKSISYIHVFNDVLLANPKMTLFFKQGINIPNIESPSELICLDYSMISRIDSPS